MNTPVKETVLQNLQLVKQGKVRDIYDLGNAFLMVASDRISAYDVVMPEAIPDKGKILNQFSLFWFDIMASVIPNHVITGDVSEFPEECQPYAEQLTGRSMLVKKVEPLSIECVVRGYISGSGWKSYKKSQNVCGIDLPAGLIESDKLPEPIFTPSAKEEVGVHDINIDFEEACRRIGKESAEHVRDISLAIYKKGAQLALQKGIIIADTKFEFGLLDGEIILIDEVLTPDSSRFWPQAAYRPGGPQPSFDKQYLRDYLDSIKWDKTPPAPISPMMSSATQDQNILMRCDPSPEATMAFDYQTVDLDQIRGDDLTYQISTGHDLHALFASINTAGLINPPILLPQENHFVIVCGFRRIAACRQFGWKQITAASLPGDTTVEMCALMAIADNVNQRELNTVELARAIALLNKAVNTADKRLEHLASLGISINAQMANKLNQINSMTVTLQQGLIKGTIALPTALRLHANPNSAAVHAICELLHQLGMSMNRQREMLDWLQAIAMRERIAEDEILTFDPISNWLQDSDMDRGHKSKLIRQYLKKRRYPEISKFEENYQNCVKALALPNRIQLVPPSHFESRQYSLQVNFSTQEELGQMSKTIQELAESSVLLKVLAPK